MRKLKVDQKICARNLFLQKFRNEIKSIDEECCDNHTNKSKGEEDSA